MALAKTGQSLRLRATTRLAAELARAVRPVEVAALARHDPAQPIDPPPVMLIGAPRSGSTLAYQVLSNQYLVDYVSNFAALFYHSLATGLALHRRLLGDSPHQAFASINGRSPGLRGPHECGMFWYRWFPRDRHFLGAGEIDVGCLDGLRQTFAAAASSSARPLLIKNLNCGQRLQVLAAVLPEARFVFVRREPLFTVQSILEGRLRVMGDPGAWWSVRPRNVEALAGLEYPAQIAGQVHALEKQIEQDLRLFPDHQSITLRYEELCRRPADVLERVAAFMEGSGGGALPRPGAVLPPFQLDERVRVDPGDFERLRRAVERLPW